MVKDVLVGFVGKPSSGKSTTLNALTDATAKTGAFPFTTIEPNHAVGYLQVPCACQRFDGQRSVPVQLLDVAGLIPGAHEGLGLGNKFLDDLRQADALVHVVDVSGTTDEKGKACRGYDPSQDVAWLQDEIHFWILNNLKAKWAGMVRRATINKTPIPEALQTQFSGYGANRETTARAYEESGIREPLDEWTDEQIAHMVATFCRVRFPMVIALNKIDHPDSDVNIARISKLYGSDSGTELVLTSAIAEVFLRRLVSQGYIKYEAGTEFVDTVDDLGPESGLRPLDEKLRARIENLRDMVLYRHGSTGVVQLLQRASERLGLVPVFPVRNIHSFTHGSGAADGVFRECYLIKRGTPMGEVAHIILGIGTSAIEGLKGRIGLDEPLEPGKNDVFMLRAQR